VSELSLTPHPTQYRSFRRRKGCSWIHVVNYPANGSKHVFTSQV